MDPLGADSGDPAWSVTVLRGTLFSFKDARNPATAKL